MRNVIFEFQGNEISLNIQEAEKLIETIENAINKSVITPKVEAYMKVFDVFLDDLTRLNNLGIRSKKVGQ